MHSLVYMKEISKEFSGTVANEGVDLEISRGEILGLLGENGAGKTTLMNILYGIYQPDSGQIFVKGQPVTFASPRDAINHGIGMVHQHFMLIPVHTVVENVILGSRRHTGWRLNWEEEAARIRELSMTYGLPIDPGARVDTLPLGMQQRVEIVKALYYDAGLLILDEPTGVLTPSEVDELLRVLRRLASEGLAVVFITHKLEEVMTVTDRVVVLRGGKNAGEVRTSETNPVELARLMVGREVLFHLDQEHDVSDEVILRLENVSVNDGRGHRALKNCSLDVRAGEVLGIAGIDGNGQRELAESILGVRPVVEGRIEILGKETTRMTPAEIHRLGVGIIPEDRHAAGLILDFTLEENLVLEQLNQPPYSRRGVLQRPGIRKQAEKLIQEYSIRAPGPTAKARQLSGGNQQKAVLARALAHDPMLVVASQPTRGLDVGATEYVRQRLLNQARNGRSVLLISTELEEIMTLSDRIAVLYEGRLMGLLSRKEATREKLGLMMAGARLSELSAAPV